MFNYQVRPTVLPFTHDGFVHLVELSRTIICRLKPMRLSELEECTGWITETNEQFYGWLLNKHVKISEKTNCLSCISVRPI